MHSKPFPVWTALGFALSLACLSFAFATGQAKEPSAPSPTQSAFFEEKIRPILATDCYGCHGPNGALSGLRVDSLEALLKGGNSGPALVPGDPDKSLLIQAVRQAGSLKMPKGGKLQPSQVADLEAWVKMGAPWPAAAAAKTAAPLWSLQPVSKPAIPQVKDEAWVKQPLDAFVLAKLESKGESPAPPADARTLLRRVTYDLTGLPPTPGEMDAFLADKSKDRYVKAVDRLLASPRYGERWARHWMDVARYADTKGYLFEEDRNYYDAYTYRAWVIDAFNNNLPYDQFIFQQLAADRLPEVQSGADRKELAALGFLTVGRRFLNNPPDIIDDRIDATMRGFEGFTVGCARCHDHKFDPIPTQDYYSLYAVFASSVETEMPISAKSISDPWEQYTKKVGKDEGAINALALEQTNRLRDEMKNPDQANALSDEVKAVLQSLGLGAPPQGANLTKLSAAFQPEAWTKLQSMQKELDNLRRDAPPKPELAMAMEDRTTCSDGVVFKRGNPGNPGEAAPRRFLLALSKPGVERTHWTNGSGRLELAKAIASKDNPLTARVFVNRLWQDHFGTGIVRTPSDFGHQGEKPTDPALLDYLATTFMESGWNIKKLQKMIVTSATYCQSSDVSAKALMKDPENRDWGRMNRRRLDLEQMRDSFMFVSARLDTSEVGGKSVELWTEPFTKRRAVYGFIDRQNLPATFRTFDFASPDSTSAKRYMTTVPQQALFFMNSPFSMEAAQSIASSAEMKTAKDGAQRVRRLYRLVFQRMPDSGEMKLGLAYLGESGKPVSAPNSAWDYGYGFYDSTSKRVTSFAKLPAYVDGVYRGGKAFPDPTLGWVMLNGQGGHPGHDANHAAIRRWKAPLDGVVSIAGALAHGQPEGDGVRARIVSSRLGLLGEWRAHNSSTKTELEAVSVKKGDTIDFVVDCIENESYDAFSWAPTVKSAGAAWSAESDFGGPSGQEVTRLTLYVQALLMSNEFSFVD